MKIIEYVFAPQTKQTEGKPNPGAFFLLILSGAALLAAPWLMPEGYSWIQHTTSESAAQGLNGAWLARFGFLAFGLAVLWISTNRKTTWARGAVWLHSVFGISMLATAAFSHQPWLTGVPFDPIEDTLHSISATVIGFAFAFGVAVRLGQELRQGKPAHWLHLLALLAATVLPILMAAQPDLPGFFQRSMFFIAYLWYGREALATPTHQSFNND
jgi:hypothetical protein